MCCCESNVEITVSECPSDYVCEYVDDVRPFGENAIWEDCQTGELRIVRDGKLVPLEETP